MGSTRTEIANFAITHIGIGKAISDLDTETSTEANICRRFYDTARDATLKDFNWGFATKYEELGLVSENPTIEWAYSYRYPSDCIFLRRILSGIRNETRQSRVSFKLSRDSAGILVYTDEREACAEYTERVTDSNLYPSDFILAFSYRLAHYIIPSLTSGDTSARRDAIFKLYLQELSLARSGSYNEEQPDELPDSEFIRARD